MNHIITMEDWVSDPEALSTLNKRYDKLVSSLLRPQSKMTGSTWANTYRILSEQTSAYPGKYRFQVAPYQKEMLDICCDTVHQRVVMMMAARSGKT